MLLGLEDQTHCCEDAGWRFFDDAGGPANIQLEPHVKVTCRRIDDLGENFEQAANSFVDRRTAAPTEVGRVGTSWRYPPTGAHR
jgi:hypothetical protein